MKFSYMSSTARFTFILFILGLILMVAGIIVIGSQGQPGASANLPQSNLWWMGFGVIMTLILLMLSSVFFTQHEVTDHEIILRQGFYFRGVIPLENVASASETLRKPLGGLGVRVWLDRTLFVNTELSNLVAIEFKQPQRFKMMYLIPLWKMRRVVVNVVEPDAFIRAIRDRLGPPESYQPSHWA